MPSRAREIVEVSGPFPGVPLGIRQVLARFLYQDLRPFVARVRCTKLAGCGEGVRGQGFRGTEPSDIVLRVGPFHLREGQKKAAIHHRNACVGGGRLQGGGALQQRDGFFASADRDLGRALSD